MPVILAILFIAAQLALTIHVSADLLQDDSCPICQVAQSPAATSHEQPGVQILLTEVMQPVLAGVSEVFKKPFQPSQRAPPSLLISC